MSCSWAYRNTIGDGDTGKANDLAAEALKQLLTLAGALLALTITFIRDFLGDSVATASCFYLVPTGWGLLGFSIWSGWVALADAARRMGTGDCGAYVFGSGKPRTLARLAQWAFFAGLACLIGFSAMNFKQPNRAKAESVTMQAKASG